MSRPRANTLPSERLLSKRSPMTTPTINIRPTEPPPHRDRCHTLSPNFKSKFKRFPLPDKNHVNGRTWKSPVFQNRTYLEVPSRARAGSFDSALLPPVKQDKSPKKSILKKSLSNLPQNPLPFMAWTEEPVIPFQAIPIPSGSTVFEEVMCNIGYTASASDINGTSSDINVTSLSKKQKLQSPPGDHSLPNSPQLKKPQVRWL